MKTNKSFYNAVSWSKKHGYDYFNQFSKETWMAANKYIELVYLANMPKSEAQKYIRENY